MRSRAIDIFKTTVSKNQITEGYGTLIHKSDFDLFKMTFR